ncbi:hypothetical protein HMPREF9120_00250 [Neisseria sp. oral taxon 020 str. F0370]|nr:hypothetical protein HMPREF9120_00250 [Neisseria sp. oral taxon 020 str. F0370]
MHCIIKPQAQTVYFGALLRYAPMCSEGGSADIVAFLLPENAKTGRRRAADGIGSGMGNQTDCL